MLRPHGAGGNMMPGAQLSALQQQQQQGQRMYAQRPQRPPNVTPTEALTPSAEWRHMMAQQQAAQAGNPNYRPGGPNANFQQMQSE